MSHDVFSALESEVKFYCRAFPTVFERARGHELFDRGGRRYIDFLAGCGALNYGHNDRAIKDAVVRYLEADGILHAMDMHTRAKGEFMEAFNGIVLQPRRLEYKIQFTGPTGTNAVEAALKLARKVTGRPTVAAFTHAFHGVTLGSLAATASRGKRRAAGIELANVTRLPFDGYFGLDTDTIALIERLIEDHGSGIDLPAAFLVETVQAEGGLNVASTDWLRRLTELAERHGILVIVDDIQAGCGRCGPFFSFERAGLYPDIVCLSKSIGGIGLPLAMLLIRPEIDQWRPGEHNGTFRGNNLAFVAARAALDYWKTGRFEAEIKRKADTVAERLAAIAAVGGANAAHVKGIGLLQGIAWERPEVSARVAATAFENGLVVETCGADDEVVKVSPPLTIGDTGLAEGLDILERAVAAVLIG
ncbi:MAG: diaminobutyrate--2-oxoglutarate transaminase [Rhodospirillales bacterium]|nr:MAG: diaminobutyrate--2-oxoglutarate transaminase [Rhodospirillales bacterium]